MDEVRWGILEKDRTEDEIKMFELVEGFLSPLNIGFLKEVVHWDGSWNMVLTYTMEYAFLMKDVPFAFILDGETKKLFFWFSGERIPYSDIHGWEELNTWMWRVAYEKKGDAFHGNDA